jgi:arylsulfatase A-like enzyme
MSAKPKNVIIITSDEMRGDCPGFMGNPDCRTPNLDRFAERGVVFRQEFAVHGKCVPSRISSVTGRYCHTDGFRTIQQHLPSDQPNWLGTLKKLGYESAVFGHNHVWEDLWGDNSKSSGYADYHSYTDDYYRPMLDREWPCPEPPTGAPTPLDLPQGYDYSGRQTKPSTGFCGQNRAEQAVDYLTKTRDRSRPFYLHVNFGSPHPPYRVAEPWFSMYDRASIQPWTHELPRNAPLHMRAMREIRTGLEIPDEVLREIQAVYYGMISRVDSYIGRVLQAIEDEGLYEDSIVLFWVDHGDFAGMYGLPEKWDTSMADCILHVPQILWAPNLPDVSEVTSLTEHVDMAPTIFELLGIEPDWGMHGESLLPIIRGEKRKEAVFADGGHEEEMWGRFSFGDPASGRPLGGKQVTYRDCPESMSRTKMVRTEKWKLVIRLTGGNELYDMENDPQELDNLWGKPELASVVMDLQQQMIEWCLRTDTDRPYQKDVGA